MSRLAEPDPGKLFLSSIYRDRDAEKECRDELVARYGPLDYSTREIEFAMTRYYNLEMGEPLWRRFYTFRRLLPRDGLREVKIAADDLEKRHLEDGRRKVNLDPGLVTMGHLELATGKDSPNRAYLGKGVYLDLTLIFESGSYKTLPWTYPDYASGEVISFLNRVREAYKNDLKMLRKGEPDTGPEQED